MRGLEAGSPGGSPSRGSQHRSQRRGGRRAGWFRCCAAAGLLAALLCMYVVGGSARLSNKGHGGARAFSSSTGSGVQGKALKQAATAIKAAGGSAGRSVPQPLPEEHVLSPGEPGKIPHILHQVFLDGHASLEEEERRAAASGERFRTFDRDWRDSCTDAHSEWRYMFWDRAAAEALLQQHYPWFLPTFQAYPKVVLKGDALRVVLMHAYGGVYADIDVECFAPVDPTLEGFDLVLQMEDKNNKSLNNAIMASRAGLLLWENAMRLLQERLPGMLAVYSAQGSSAEQLQHAVLNATGPWLLRDAFAATFHDAGSLAAGYAGEHAAGGLRLMVHPVGTWYEPCEWNDLECHLAIEEAAAAGEMAPSIVGHHKNAGSWLKMKPPPPPEPLAGIGGSLAASSGAVLRLRVSPARDALWGPLGVTALGVLAAVAAALAYTRRRAWLGGNSSGAPRAAAAPPLIRDMPGAALRSPWKAAAVE